MTEKIDVREIISKIKEGPFKAREITKKETHEKSKEIKDEAWKFGEKIIKEIGIAFFQYPPAKKYPLFSKEFMLLGVLYTEIVKTYQNAFRLAEEGYYRSAFGELRDLLEQIMKIKLFYEEISLFKKWVKDANVLYTTKELRKTDLFKNAGLNEKIANLSNALSNNRHSSFATLDANGPVNTNVSYYRKDLFEKWCKHLILLSELSSEIIDIKPK